MKSFSQRRKENRKERKEDRKIVFLAAFAVSLASLRETSWRAACR
jgi:hypothetical protein